MSIDVKMINTFPLLFSFAFRCLFLLVVAQAVIHVTLWFAIWHGLMAAPSGVISVYWHGHEMIMGFAGAAIAGFLLTAVATWTGRPQVRGWPLVVLCLSWLVARLWMISPILAMAGGIFYWVWLLALMGREVVTSANSRNYKVVFILFVFLVLELLYYYSQFAQATWQRQIVWAQIWVVVIMINLIGGRIIPAFTRNWLLRQQGEVAKNHSPAPFGKVDYAATIALLIFGAATLLSLSGPLMLSLAIVTSVLQAWRLLRWQGLRCLADPLVWMMHLSYAWIPIGVLLMGLGQAGYVTISAGIHALTIGTIASMIVSVSSRAALGHTGRPLQAHPLLTIAIVLITFAALSRVGAAIVGNDALMTSATGLWIAGFLSFAIRYVPVLISPSRG